ncbi:class E sortase [Streptomyces sp. NPDC058579]|uniref:class E sortase n=1 Tax=Streptomyces sp. NPDC058579 TaxID=3346548 RepID=UPI00365537E9
MTTGSPWFRATNVPEDEPQAVPAQPEAIPGYEQTAYPYEQEYAYPQEYPDQQPYAYEPIPEPAPSPDPVAESPYEAPQEPYEAAYEPRDETMGLRTVEPAGTPETAVTPLAGPGRAERRRAAKGKGRKGGLPAPAPDSETPDAPAAPMSRVEARRAARAAKDSVGVVASRVVGEVFITFGVVMLLFVTYQLWWTNVRADQQANQAKGQIEDAWSKGRAPGAFEPGQGFAIMYIPKLDVVVPVAEGISKPKVLDRGMVGHYSEGTLKTAMPGDKQGNFAVAGHRNTHGEPFRYINQLEPGDPIVVETQDAYYTYEMASILPQTAPSNVSVIDPVPKQAGFKQPGRYITLTTCTPEFTSTYRMIVWGKMVEERPRSKGKPDALLG